MRYLKLRRKLNEALATYPGISLVCYEKSFQRGQAAREIHHKFVGEVESWCAEHWLQHTHVYAVTLKKFATGKGNASKADMMSAGLRKWSPTTNTEDEMDALWIMEYALVTHG